MIKKFAISLVVSAMLVTPAVSGNTLAASQTIEIHDGLLEKGRVMIPLRHVSQYLGAEVDWHQPSQTVTITREQTTIRLTIGSPVMQVNGAEVSLDVPASLYYSGLTFVPLRFVGQAFGAEIDWQAQRKQATVALGERRLVIGMTEPPIQVPSARRVTDHLAGALVTKLNEATDFSGIKQIRTHFRPYFTDTFINKLIAAGGLEHKQRITHLSPSAIRYTSQSTAVMSQYYSVERDFAAAQTLYRRAELVATASGWKVNDVSFQIVEEVRP